MENSPVSWLQTDEAEGAGGQECVEAEGRGRALLGLRSGRPIAQVLTLKIADPVRCALKAVSSVQPSLSAPTGTLLHHIHQNQLPCSAVCGPCACLPIRLATFGGHGPNTVVKERVMEGMNAWPPLGLGPSLWDALPQEVEGRGKAASLGLCHDCLKVQKHLGVIGCSFSSDPWWLRQ